MERKLVSIRTIEKIIPIDGADRIEIAAIGAWHIIVPKGIYLNINKKTTASISGRWIALNI